MLDSTTILDRLDLAPKDLYVCVEGFKARKVKDVPTCILKMAACQGSEYIMLKDPAYDTVGSIGWTSDGLRGFRVKDIVLYKDGLLMVFELYDGRGR